MEIATAHPFHRSSPDDDFLIANSYVLAGQVEKAVEVVEATLERSRREGNPFAETASLGNLGDLHRRLGHVDLVRGFIEQARVLHCRHGDAQGEAEDIRQLAALDPGGDEPREDLDIWQATLASPDAEEHLARMLRDASTKEDRFMEFNALDGLGVVARTNGAPEDAIRWHRQAQTLAERNEGLRGVVATVIGNNNLGIAYRMIGDSERAADCYRAAIHAARERLGAGNPLELLPRSNLAKLHLSRRDLEAAKKYLD
jgi:tetratricopeptide (TPR) repeat protein